MSEEETSAKEVKAARRSGSLFGPIILIAVGVFLLMDNLNLLPDLNWGVALRLWPLLLIGLGLNLIVRQAPPPIGTLLSGLVAVTTVAFFGWLLVAGEDVGLAGVTVDVEVQREEVSFPADDLASARVVIDFSEYRSQLTALSDSPNLIEGSIAHRGQVVFDADRSGDLANVRLSTSRADNGPLFWINPANWQGLVATDARWQIGLNPSVPLFLDLDMSSGSADLDLSALALNELRVDGSSGSVDLRLPDGDYEARYDISSGSSEIWLPVGGRQTIQVDGGSGSLTFYLPDEAEARVVVASGGSGSFRPGRLVQVESGDGDEGTWQSEGYSAGSPGATIILDIGSGSVSVRQP